jgi:undecaprenyl diphosphate synthase
VKVDSVDAERLRHIAIIMDGNGRWAKREGKQSIVGHKAGAERIRDVLAVCRKNQVDVLTLFAFSSENWRRPPAEVEALMSLFYNYLKREARKLADEDVRLKIIGSRLRFSEGLLRAIEEAESIASQGSSTLVIAADYGGQWDLLQATQKLAQAVAEGRLKPEDITAERMDQQLSTADLPPLDLMVRTSGELRISNFLIWQAAYAELYFTHLYWPDFDGNAMQAAIDDYYQRQRRFGLTSEQLAALQDTKRA